MNKDRVSTDELRHDEEIMSQDKYTDSRLRRAESEVYMFEDVGDICKALTDSTPEQDRTLAELIAKDDPSVQGLKPILVAYYLRLLGEE